MELVSEEPGVGPGLPDSDAPDPDSPCFLARQVTQAEGAALAGRFGCLFFEVSACLDFEHVQHVFHEAVREARRELEKNSLARPLFISEERAVHHQAPLTARHGLASCTFNTLSTTSLKEVPAVAQAKLVTVKSSRAQSKKGCRREQWICRRIPKESIVSTGQETDFCFFPAASPWAAHPTPQR